MQRKLTGRKAELIEEVVQHLRTTLPGEDTSAAGRFVRQFYANVPLRTIGSWSRESLLGAAMALFQLASRRSPGTPCLRVYNPTDKSHGWHLPDTVVEIVTDDMPFLVDSVANVLQRRELPVQVVIHPVIAVRRDADGRLTDLLEAGAPKAGSIAESCMHFQVSAQPDEALPAIAQALAAVLDDVRAAVSDWSNMVARLTEVIAGIAQNPPPLPPHQIGEGRAFLEWIKDHHFTFLGYRAYDLVAEGGKDYLRYREGTGLGVLRRVKEESRARHKTPLAATASAFARRKELLAITKAYDHSTVHRPVRMDYIGVRTFGPDGEVTGEQRFLGLFTSSAYNESPRQIPMLRDKVRRVLERASFAPKGHDGRALLNILETYPRDELLQVDWQQLHETCIGILQLQHRQRTALFVRRDPFEVFVSCLVYVSRDAYSTKLRRRFQAILEEAYDGKMTDYYTQVGDSPLARLQYIIGTKPGHVPSPPVEETEARLVEEARSWSESLGRELVHSLGESLGRELFRRHGDAFPTAYRESTAPEEAIRDIGQIEAVLAGESLGINLFRLAGDPYTRLRLKIYHRAVPVPLSDILPILEHMGLKVISENPFRVTPPGAEAVWIHDFSMDTADGTDVTLRVAKEPFQVLLARVWAREVEDDDFNRLALRAGLDWRGIVVLRAYCKYLRQTGIPFSERYMQETLARNPGITAHLVDLFRARFDPHGTGDPAQRGQGIRTAIEAGLERVSNLDEDRILRRFLNLILSTLRTNYYQPGADGHSKPYLALKLDSQALEDLPLPRPMVETWVYSPRTEAVHLRGGKVARGGIRWSDRREDFRTEVLGLMKAQMVKNAVIVPVGSKGGFIVKCPPREGGHEALMAEVVACYRTMMGGLLDLVDNLKGGEIVPPASVVRHDGDDPYLVVAADKGTATFSDIANGVSEQYGFWLGDAYASGGSAGYDHKKMGITARGGWEAVKRHFREMGRDCQSEDFLCAAVGDMSGDVFGNAMLLSRHIRLVGAFNHMHIFVDPEPDAERSFRERERLFALPRSTWMDYDVKAMGPGGGIFPRSAKSIEVTPPMRQRFGLTREKVTPTDLIRAILGAPVDLLWFGGIGTYVKASDQSHVEVGDRANEALRLDAKDLRCKVIGEGANLALTQPARVEFSLHGGRLNTDAIDNSGGVDCSDHEVNIKIALGGVVAAGGMTRPQRDTLLVQMTDDVADLVLRDNYLQTQALTVEEARGLAIADQHARLMRTLERGGQLNRALEFLPDDMEMQERAANKRGLTRPELAVLLAYSKISVYDQLLRSDLPDDPLLVEDLLRYFPEPLSDRFGDAVKAHRLRREIIATSVTNSMVNRVGPAFVNEMVERTGLPVADIARSYAVARDIFELRRLWVAVEELDTKVPAALQVEMLLDIGQLTERATLWFCRHGRHPIDMSSTTKAFRPGVATLAQEIEGLLAHYYQEVVERKARHLVDRGVPALLARDIAILTPLSAACDIVGIATGRGLEVAQVGRVHYETGARFGLDRLRGAARRMPCESEWEKQALHAILDDLYGQHRALTGAILDDALTVDDWCAARGTAFTRARDVVLQVLNAPKLDIAMLAVATRQIAALSARVS